MDKWLPIQGEFTEENNKIVFHGGIYNGNGANVNNSAGIPSGKVGVILFQQAVSTGTIEMDVEFEKLEYKDEAQIVFDYHTNSYRCAGIALNGCLYDCKRFEGGQWKWDKMFGSQSHLPKNKFHIRVDINGSVVTLWVDGINLFSVTLQAPISLSHVGIMAISKSSITFSNYKVVGNKRKAFVISQFGTDYDVLFNDVITPVCEENKLDAVRADKVNTSTPILSDIIMAIRNSELIIAEISPDNPNVFYEVGYAHALNKPTILMCEQHIREKLPFDVSGFRTIFYDNSIGGKKKVEENLRQYVKEVLKVYEG